MDCVESTWVVKEGDILLVSDGPTAGAVPSFLPLIPREQPWAFHVRQRQVIVFAVGGALSAAVMEDYRFIADVSQAQLTDRHLHVS